MIAMRVAVLDDRRRRRLRQSVDETRFHERRNDGERDGNVRVDARFRATGASAGESRQASSSRHHRSARRPAARQASSSSSRGCHAHGASLGARAWRCARVRLRGASATIAALRVAPSLSKFHVPQRSRVPAESTAAARISGEYVRSSTTTARSNASRRTPRARCSVSPLPVNGTTTGRAPLVTTSSTVL